MSNKANVYFVGLLLLDFPFHSFGDSFQRSPPKYFFVANGQTVAGGRLVPLRVRTHRKNRLVRSSTQISTKYEDDDERHDVIDAHHDNNGDDDASDDDGRL